MRLALFFCLITSLAAAQSPLVQPLPLRFDGAISIDTDPDGRLWILASDGVYRYAGSEAEKVVSVEAPSALFFDENTLAIGTEAGTILTANPFTGKVTSQFSLPDSVEVTELLRFGGWFLISTAGSGIYQCGELGEKPRPAKQLNLSDPFVHDMAVVGEKLFVATDRGVDVFSGSFEKVASYAEVGIASSLAVWNGRVYAGSFNRGLWIIDGEGVAARVESAPTEVAGLMTVGNKLIICHRGGISTLSEKGVSSLSNRSGVLGMAAYGTRGIGVLYSDADPEFIDLEFSTFPSVAESDITCLIAVPNTVYYSTADGVFGFDKASGEVVQHFQLPGKPLVASMESAGETLFVGTFNDGVYIIDISEGSFRQVGSDAGLPDDNVLSMSFARDTLWVATLSGLSAIWGGAVHPYINAPGLGSTYIYDVASHRGSLFVATDGKGVFRFRQGVFTPVPSPEGELDQTTAYSFAGSGDSLWCITREKGVFRYREREGDFARYGSLESTGFSSFGASSQGDLLVLNEEGLTLMSDSTKLVFSRESFGDSWSGSYLQTFGRSGDGEVYFSSGKSIFAFEPLGEISPPEVFLHHWNVNFEPANPGETQLGAAEINHSFALGSSWFADTRNQSFSYKLRGIDAEFKSSRSGEISYPNLPYGSYELLARPGYNGVYYGNPVSLLRFSIAKPFYLQAWFIALAVLGGVLLVVLIVRIRVGQVNKARLSEKRLVETELAVLRNQINPHFLFNSFNTLLNMIETHPDKAGNYLQKLSDFYRRMLDKRSDQVVVLAEELEVLREYVYLQQQRFGKALLVDIRLSAVLQESKIPALTLQLLVENAIKHNVVSGSRPLTIEIFEEDGFLAVRNRLAPKHKTEPGTGTGLENILSRYRALFNAEARVETTDEFFTVYIPIISP